MTTTRVSVPGVHCDQCVASIDGAVSKEEGVQSVQVDLSTKQVTVEHNPRVTVEELVGVIEDQGYEVESFEEVSAK